MSYDKEYYEKYCGKMSFNPMRVVRRYENYISKHDKILIVGCEDERMVKALRNHGFNAYGSDINPYGIERSSPQMQKYLIVDDILHTKIAENSFDLVICRFLLEHFSHEEIALALKNLHKISRRLVYIGVTSVNNKHFKLDKTHKTALTTSQWNSLLLSSNLFDLLKSKESSEEWLFLVKKSFEAEKFEDIGYQAVGKHITLDFAGCNSKLLNDVEELQKFCERSVKEAGSFVVKSITQRFFPYGVSICTLLGESHVSFHTYPEVGVIFIDGFFCGEKVNLEAFEKYLVSVFQPKRKEKLVLERGWKGGK